MPSISRTGRSGSSPRRLWNRTPSSRVRWCSRAVLYTSDAATFALYSARPSIDSHAPSSSACTLFAMATWVCRSGSPARESRWVNAAASIPLVSTCRTPWRPRRVYSAWLSR